MSLESIKVEEWFDDDSSEEGDDPIQLTLKGIKAEATKVLIKIQTQKNKPDEITFALFDFYKAWKRLDPEDIADIRDLIFDFIKEVVQQSETSLNPHEVLSDIQFGHVGIEFRPMSELFTITSKEEIENSVQWLVSNLKKEMKTEIPGFMTIKIRKNEPTAYDQNPPPFTVSYSFKIKNVNEETELIDPKPDVDFPTPPISLSKSLHSLAQALIIVVKQKNAPLKIEGLGVFQIEEVPAYEGRNPATGKFVQVPSSKRLLFRLDRSLLKSLS